jgi:hypothetical protein
MVLAAPLLMNVVAKKREGLARPLNYPVAPHVRKAADAYMTDWPEVDVLTIARWGVEPHAGIAIMLAADGVIEPRMLSGLTDAIHQARGDQAPVQIHSLLRAPIVAAAD